MLIQDLVTFPVAICFILFSSLVRRRYKTQTVSTPPSRCYCCLLYITGLYIVLIAKPSRRRRRVWEKQSRHCNNSTGQKGEVEENKNKFTSFYFVPSNFFLLLFFISKFHLRQLAAADKFSYSVSVRAITDNLISTLYLALRLRNQSEAA